MRSVTRCSAQIAGVDPGLVGGLRREAGVRAWLGPDGAAVRGPDTRRLAWVGCLPRARQGGHGRPRPTAVARPDACCDALARGVGRAVGAAVTTAPVEAYDADTDGFVPMVLVRAGPEFSAGWKARKACETARAPTRSNRTRLRGRRWPR